MMEKPVDSNNSQAHAIHFNAAVPSNGYVRSETFDNDHNIRVGEWEAPLFSCFTSLVPNCLMVLFCPCVSLAQISARLGVSSYSFILVAFFLVIAAMFVLSGLIVHEIYSNESSFGGYLSALFSKKDYSTAYHVYCGLMVIPVYTWIRFLIHLREKTRERFQLSAGSCEDFCVVFWCSCCTMAQIATHIKSYKPGSCSFDPPDTLPPYPLDEEGVGTPV